MGVVVGLTTVWEFGRRHNCVGVGVGLTTVWGFGRRHNCVKVGVGLTLLHSGKVPMGEKPLALSDSVTQITT